MRTPHLVSLPLLVSCLCAQQTDATFRLSDQDQAAGWVVLFDGSDTGHWRGYRKEAFPEQGWSVVDGALQIGKGGGDLITRRRFGDFELDLQFRTTPGANSGILYRVTEEEDHPYWTGPEFQVLDDAGAGVAAGAPTSAGALYGLYAPAADKKLAPAGEWNDARIVLRSGRVEHWLNGARLVAADLSSDDWRQRVADSKFGEWQRFGAAARGHICLQDHGNEVSYRRIRIRELPPGPERLGEKIALFDGGTDLSAWDCHLPAEGSKLEDVWRVEDGVLICRGSPTGYIYTRETFDNFVLSLSWRFDPEKGAGNSGVLLRVTGEHKVWPRCIEAQLHSGNAGDFWNIGGVPMETAAERTRGRNTKKTHPNEQPVGEWNRYEIVVDGPWVRLSVNGEVLNEAWHCEVVPGHIALQSEGAEIHFKDVFLQRLK